MNRLRDRGRNRLGIHRSGAIFASGLWLLLVAAASLAPNGSRSAAWASTIQSNPYALIEDELYDEERESFSAFLGTLTQPEQDVLTSFANRLDDGERGLFALLLIESNAQAAKDLLALLARLDNPQLTFFASDLGNRPFTQWQAIPVLLQSSSIAEAEIELFLDAGQDDCWLESGGQMIGGGGFDSDRPVGATICSDAALQFRSVYRHKPLRVIRGVLARDGEAPWQAQLALHGAITRANHSAADRAKQIEDFGEPLDDWEINHACGAAYIGGRFLLTAAHCIGGLRDADFFDGRRIRLGTRRIDGNHNLVKIRTVTRHADYQSDTHANDIALIELQETPNFSRLKAAGLPTTAKANPPAWTSLLLTGWGYSKATWSAGNARAIDGQFQQRAMPELLKGTVRLQPNSACNNNSNFRKKKYRILNGQLCAGSDTGVDSCRGDSGGPLVDTRDGTLIGLVSYGPGCGLKDTPGVYVDVRYYADWVARAKKAAAKAKPQRKYLFR
jgi:secreted trypsin-like serine protease